MRHVDWNVAHHHELRASDNNSSARPIADRTPIARISEAAISRWVRLLVAPFGPGHLAVGLLERHESGEIVKPAKRVARRTSRIPVSSGNLSKAFRSNLNLYGMTRSRNPPCLPERQAAQPDPAAARYAALRQLFQTDQQRISSEGRQALVGRLAVSSGRRAAALARCAGPLRRRKSAKPVALRPKVAYSKAAGQAGGVEENPTGSRKLHAAMLTDGPPRAAHSEPGPCGGDQRACLAHPRKHGIRPWGKSCYRAPFLSLHGAP